MANVVIDPVTRIEGHLRVEIEVDGGVVKDAWVSGTLYRGMETVLKDRHPQDAFYIAQRICGVCPISHGHASTMAAEKALGVSIPNNARIIRNLIEGAELLHSHILWFYTLTALDYVDPAKALTANIADTYALAEQAGTSTADFGGIAQRLKTFVESGKLSVLSNAYFGHPAIPKEIPAELHLIATAHYLEALTLQGDAAEIISIMGGKFPHFMTSIPGGTAWVPTEEKLDDILFRIRKVRDFVNNTMIPDTLALAPFYKDALSYGAGVGNLLAWGVFDDKSFDPKKRFMPRGAVLDGKLEVVDATEDKVLEAIDHSWYKSGNNLQPSKGETLMDFSEPDLNGKYSWVKAPRYDGRPTEVGPLARMVVAYLSGVAPVKEVVDLALDKLGAAGKPEVLLSLLGRVAARNLEAKVVADQMETWLGELIEAVKGGDAKFFEAPTASEGEGAGLWEAPRGALGHWMTVKNGKIANYQVVTPSTWDLSPRDADGKRGPMEEALVGTPILDPEKPLEALRIVHSFDP